MIDTETVELSAGLFDIDTLEDCLNSCCDCYGSCERDKEEASLFSEQI